MTPKEKAKELVDKYLCIEDEQDLFCDECGMSQEAAKQCALITVDEILDDCEWYSYKIQLGKEYWQEVKKEIEKL